MQIRIRTIGHDFVGECTQAEYNAIMASLNSSTAMFFRMPDNIMTNTNILKNAIISVSLEDSSDKDTTTKKNSKVGN